MRRRFLLGLLLVVMLPLPATAGILFGKKTPKPTPQERVPELIKIVQSDGDENKPPPRSRNCGNTIRLSFPTSCRR